MQLIFREKKISVSQWNFTPNGFKILETTCQKYRIMEIDKIGQKSIKPFYRVLANRSVSPRPAWVIIKDRIKTVELAKDFCQNTEDAK